MKFLLSFILLFATSVFAQTTSTTTVVHDKNHTLSVFGSVPEMNQLGLSLEFMGNTSTHTMNDKSFSMYSSKIVNVAYGMMNYEIPLLGKPSVDGKG